MEIGRGSVLTIGLYDSTIYFRNFISNGFFSVHSDRHYTPRNRDPKVSESLFGMQEDVKEIALLECFSACHYKY